MKLNFKIFFKESRTTLFLIAIVTICVALLFFVNKLTEGPRKAVEKQEEDIAVATLLASLTNPPEMIVDGSSGATGSDEIVVELPQEVDLLASPINVEWIKVEGNRFVLKYALHSTDEGDSIIINLMGSGYGGAIKIMALYSQNGNFIDAMVVDHSETDGIGTKIAEKGYFQRFVGYGETLPIPSSKRKVDPKYVDSITGVTVSFVAVAKILQQGADFIQLTLNMDGIEEAEGGK